MTIHELLIQKLMSANAHIGRRGATHHFKVFTYGSRNGMTVIDSDKTLICLRNACDFIGNLVRLNGRFLFVNTNPLYDEIVDQMTQKIGYGSSSKSQYWRLCGFLTNSSSPKKFKSRNKKIIFGPTQAPDCLVIMDTANKSSVIKEASRLEIPIVGLVDSNMPLETYSKITYPIPCNDSAKFVYLFCNLITKTFLLEQKRMGVSSPAENNLDLLVTPTSAEHEPVKHNSQEGDRMGVSSRAEDILDLLVTPTSAQPELLKDIGQEGDSVERGLEEESKSTEE
ncbi:hypothetical protein V2J09_015597 [Rumex salicifolius]